MSLSKYLVLLAIMTCGAVGDLALAIGVKQIPITNATQLFQAVTNPWVALGIIFLMGFFAAYLAALSWADLTYVLPATSMGYVLIALFSQIFLHEHVTMLRWLGIVLISAGVGFVARGPVLTIAVERNLKSKAG